MDIFARIAEKIIIEQEKIVGPIALEQARKVHGLSVDMGKHEIKFAGNQKEILENLVKQFGYLFGQASIEVCRDAARKFWEGVPKENIPLSLQ